MEKNYDIAIKEFEEKLLKALRENDKKAIIILYGNLCVFEYRTLSSEYPEVISLGYKSQEIKSEAFDYLML